jgi:hypothetical protein
VFDPKEHKITLDATQTVEMRRALEDVGVEILGKKADGGAIIGLVTDVLTGKTDGTISVGGDIIITGEKIKIFPKDGDDELGVFFVNVDSGEIPLDYPLTQNDPKKIVCRLPVNIMDGGVYTLKIVTRYSNGSVVLKTPHTLLYELPLTAVAPQS